jgi:hypothetical protein
MFTSIGAASTGPTHALLATHMPFTQQPPLQA